MGAIAEKWRRKWGAWDSRARPILKSNAEGCRALDGIEKMECIAEKNRTNVTKSALGIGP